MGLEAGVTVQTAEHAMDRLLQAHRISDDILYARADANVVMRTVNDAFAKVSGYSISELVGMPHQALRDTQTPRAVYNMLWGSLGAGQPAATYLCSRTRSGDSHWVFAIVLPVNDGFISLQLPPMAPIFKEIPEIYRDTVAREVDEGAEPDRNALVLRRVALQHGFPSHDSFVACALMQELAVRDVLKGAATDPHLRALSEMNETLVQGMRDQVGLIRSFGALQLIPNNMRIIASQLEPSGGPISAIAENYKASSMVISRRLQAYVGGDQGLCEVMARGLSRSLILTGCIRLLTEVWQRMLSAPLPPEMVEVNRRNATDDIPHRRQILQARSWEAERHLLEQVIPQLAGAAQQAIAETITASARLGRASIEIRRHMLGLDTIRILGRVECCRMPDAGGLAETIDQLDAFHAGIKSRLETIILMAETTGYAMEELQDTGHLYRR
ncbi:MAG TPA: PAS domain S-box protein [Paenirhodobacter sp.]